MNPLASGIAVQRPPHDDAPDDRKPVRVMSTWPVGTFVENLVVRPDGKVLVSVHSTRTIELVDEGGRRETLATLPGPIAGMVVLGDALFVNVGAPGQPPGHVFRVDARGSVEPWIEIPDALFLNGASTFIESRILVGDAVRGRILEVDVAARTHRVWLEHPSLGKVTAEPWLPGVNGLKVFGRHVYFSNTDAARIHRVPFDPAGRAGAVETVAERFTCDDFAFDVDGSLYGATHVYNSVVRLAPDGTRAVLANAADGLAGATAIAFGRGAADDQAAYVTTTGGILAPHEGRVREAKLLRIEVGAVGAAIGAS